MREPDQVIAVRTDLRIVDESPDWLVVEKPAPLIVHPTSAKREPTMIDLLRRQLEARGEDAGTLSIVNRLDRETSGLVLVARTSAAARRFGKAMQRRAVGKEYLAIVLGWPEWEEIEIEAPILRRGEVEESAIWVKQMVHPEGRPCATGLRVEQRVEVRAGRCALVRAAPRTGRTHQIRVHLAHCGHPIVGDKIYGSHEECYLEFIETGWSESLQARLHLERQALHSAQLAIPWQEGELTWESGLPSELVAFLNGPSRSGREEPK